MDNRNSGSNWSVWSTYLTRHASILHVFFIFPVMNRWGRRRRRNALRFSFVHRLEEVFRLSSNFQDAKVVRFCVAVCCILQLRNLSEVSISNSSRAACARCVLSKMEFFGGGQINYGCGHPSNSKTALTDLNRKKVYFLKWNGGFI